MRRNTRWYAIAFLFFVALVIVAMVQNLTVDAEVSFLWIKTKPSILILMIWILWLLQWIMLVVFIRSFFTSMQRSELSKFELDKPL